MRYLLVGFFLVGSAVAQDGVPTQDSKKTETESEQSTGPKVPRETSGEFRPTEEVSPDQEVDFPADI